MIINNNYYYSCCCCCCCCCCCQYYVYLYINNIITTIIIINIVLILFIYVYTCVHVMYSVYTCTCTCMLLYVNLYMYNHVHWHVYVYYVLTVTEVAYAVHGWVVAVEADSKQLSNLRVRNSRKPTWGEEKPYSNLIVLWYPYFAAWVRLARLKCCQVFMIPSAPNVQLSALDEEALSENQHRKCSTLGVLCLSSVFPAPLELRGKNRPRCRPRA